MLMRTELIDPISASALGEISVVIEKALKAELIFEPQSTELGGKQPAKMKLTTLPKEFL